MKKIFLLAATAAFAMTSCSNDQTLDQNPNNAISFKPLTTKAPLTTTNNIEDFAVYAYYDANKDDMSSLLNPGFMYHTVVSGGIGAWDYTPHKYWPSEGQLHFFAFSPAALTGITSTKVFSPATDTPEVPTLTYTVAPLVGDQEDLLVASALNEVKKTTAVEFTFDHALSQIIFKAISGVPTLTFDISEIKIVNVNNEGTYNFYGTPGWSDQSGTEEYTASLANATDIPYSSSDFNTLTGTGGVLMLMPQQLVAADPLDLDAGGSYISVTYKAKDNPSGAYVVGSSTTSVTKILPISTLWEQGNRYIYQLTFNEDDDNMEPITFDVLEVNDWLTPSSNTTDL